MNFDVESLQHYDDKELVKHRQREYCERVGRIQMVSIKIVGSDITKLDTDAVVNAANKNLSKGSGVCGAIFKAAGEEELRASCEKIGQCETGSAVITPGFKMNAKYIIHAVGPVWYGGKHDEAEYLRNTYRAALTLAMENECQSIGFPLISAGMCGYPIDKAWREAISECMAFRRDYPESDMSIVFAVIDRNVMATGERILKELYKEHTTVYIAQLEADSFERIKSKFSRQYHLLIDQKAHPIAGGLLAVLCEKKTLQTLSARDMMKICEALFPESILEESWLIRYADIMLRVVNDNKPNVQDDRAARYEKYLQDVLVPTLKAGAQSGDVLDDLDTLVDFYKVLACLMKKSRKGKKEFIFEADFECMERLNFAIMNVKGMGNNVLGIELSPIRTEDKQYATFLSWVLEELLYKQDAIMMGGEK